MRSGIPRKAPGHVARNIGNEVVIVPIRQRVEDLASVFVLRDAGAHVWELIDGTASVDRIATRVASDYRIASERAARDVDEFLASLEAEGIVAIDENRSD